MKKLRFLLVCLLLLWMLPAVGASAQEAVDITSDCTFSSSSGKHYRYLKDSQINTCLEINKRKNAYLQIDASVPIGGIYITWYRSPEAWSLQSLQEGQWVEIGQGAPYGFIHEYIEVSGDTSIRIAALKDERRSFKIAEMRVYGQGEMPSSVQKWEPTPEKADLMVISAHPDDEYIFFGGTIPYYAAQQQKDVVVVYMTYASRLRRTELLNGLWSVGLRTYPVLGGFPDELSYNIKDGYKAWGKTKTLTYVTELFRKYKPEVVVTHDLKGEYGHGAHCVSGDSVMQCTQFAQDQEKYPDSAAEYGTWEVKKVYLHLYPENQIYLDWHQPIDELGGITALEAAKRGFTYHESQQGGSIKLKSGRYVFTVEDGGMFDNALFGLFYSTVGMDTEKNDFFENLN